MNYCKYGCRQEGIYKLVSGWCCSRYHSQCPVNRKKNSEGSRKAHIGKHHGEETKNKIRVSIMNNPNITGRAFTPEKELLRKKRISKAMKKYGGYRKGSGRGKKGYYKGIWCDSSYELAFVIYNLENNISFKKNWKKFRYLFEGKKHNYIPDFVMDDGTYIEIKGYETKELMLKNEAKYMCFPYKLVILNPEDMKHIFEYVGTKYGKQYVSLYD